MTSNSEHIDRLQEATEPKRKMFHSEWDKRVAKRRKSLELAIELTRAEIRAGLV